LKTAQLLRSPSPRSDDSDLTPEQLAEPQIFYVLIHEAFKNPETGQPSLQKIYRAIEHKYPYYNFGMQTKGWQSSIRHNLGMQLAFRNNERDGRRWMWGLVPS